MNNIIASIDAEIAQLRLARAALTGTGAVAKSGPGRPKAINSVAKVAAPAAKSVKRRKLSAEGKARIAAAQKARWAKLKKPAIAPIAVKKTAAKKSVVAKKSVAVKKEAAVKSTK